MTATALHSAFKITATAFFVAAVFLLSPYALPISYALESLTGTAELPRAKRPSHPWGKDPFVPLVTATTTHNGINLKLTAIFYNAVKPSAIINGNIVTVGSVVSGQKVIAIDKTHVILQGETGKVKLDIAYTPEQNDDKK